MARCGSYYREIGFEKDPLLFGKWKPESSLKVKQNTLGTIWQEFDFPFASVDIKTDRTLGGHYISAESPHHREDASIDELFEPNILKLYFDGKKMMEELLVEASRIVQDNTKEISTWDKIKNMIIPNKNYVDVEINSLFGRTTNLDFFTDYLKLGIYFHETEKRIVFAKEAAENLVALMKKEFGESKDKKHMFPLFYCDGALGETFNLGSGIHLNVGFPNKEPKEEEEFKNLGSIYIQVISDETATKEYHSRAIELCKSFCKEYKGGKFMENPYFARDPYSRTRYFSPRTDRIAWRVEVDVPFGFSLVPITEDVIKILSNFTS